MATLDLSQAARARQALRETNGAEQHRVKFKDWSCKLPHELPGEYSFALGEGDLAAAFRSLFGPEEFENFRALHPTTPDLKELSKGIGKLYGFDSEGESEPSDAS